MDKDVIVTAGAPHREPPAKRWQRSLGLTSMFAIDDKARHMIEGLIQGRKELGGSFSRKMFHCTLRFSPWTSFKR